MSLNGRYTREAWLHYGGDTTLQHIMAAKMKEKSLPDVSYLTTLPVAFGKSDYMGVLAPCKTKKRKRILEKLSLLANRGTNSGNRPASMGDRGSSPVKKKTKHPRPKITRVATQGKLDPGGPPGQEQEHGEGEDGKDEEVEVYVEDAKLRKKFRRMALRALESELAAKTSNTTQRNRKLAIAIEQQLYCESGERTCDEYRAKSRALLFNLRDKANSALRLRLIDGSLTPQDLVKLSTEELANSEVRLERNALNKANLAAVIPLEPTFCDTQDYMCPRCSGKDTAFRRISMRTIASKCDTWGSKDAPSLTLEFRCLSCPHKWKRAE